MKLEIGIMISYVLLFNVAEWFIFVIAHIVHIIVGIMVCS